MIDITLINCKQKLEAMGVFMELIGSGAIFSDILTRKIPYLSWEYDFALDKILIWVDDGMSIPDLSEFGEVVLDGAPIG